MDSDKILTQVFKSGKLFSLNVNKWSFAVQLEAQDLELASVPEEYRLGKKWLVDKKVINQFFRLETTARNTLKTWSVRFPIAGIHFVPTKAETIVCGELDKVIADYDILSKWLIDNFQRLKKEYLDQHPKTRKYLEPFYPTVEELKGQFGMKYQRFTVKATNGELDLKDFVEGTIKTLKERGLTALYKIQGRLETGQTLTEKKVSKVLEAIDQITMLNFVDPKATEKIRLTNSLSIKEVRAAVKAIESISSKNYMEE